MEPSAGMYEGRTAHEGDAVRLLRLRDRQADARPGARLVEGIAPGGAYAWELLACK